MEALAQNESFGTSASSEVKGEIKKNNLITTPYAIKDFFKINFKTGFTTK